MGKNSIAVETTPYYLGAPIQWNGQNNKAASPILANATTSSPTPSVVQPGTQAPVPPSQAPPIQAVPGSNTTGPGGALVGNVTTPTAGSPVIPPAGNNPGTASTGGQG
jgi:hypothetical protein